MTLFPNSLFSFHFALRFSPVCSWWAHGFGDPPRSRTSMQKTHFVRSSPHREAASQDRRSLQRTSFSCCHLTFLAGFWGGTAHGREQPGCCFCANISKGIYDAGGKRKPLKQLLVCEQREHVFITSCLCFLSAPEEQQPWIQGSLSLPSFTALAVDTLATASVQLLEQICELLGKFLWIYINTLCDLQGQLVLYPSSVFLILLSQGTPIFLGLAMYQLKDTVSIV